MYYPAIIFKTLMATFDFIAARTSLFTARCTIVQSAVRYCDCTSSVRPSVRPLRLWCWWIRTT